MTIIGRNEGLSNPPDRAEPPAMPNPSAQIRRSSAHASARCCASTRRARELASATPRASHPARRRLTARPLAVRFPPSARRAPSPRSARRPRASPARVPRRIQARPSRPPPRHAVVRHERRARGRGVDEHRRGGRARRRRHEGARGERVHEAQGPAPVLGVLAVGPPAVLRGLGVARGGPAMLEMRQGQARREGRRVPQGPPRFRQAEQRQDGPRPQPPEEAGGERVQRREARRGPTDPEPRSLLRLKPRGGSRSNPRESLRLVRRRRAPRPPAGAPRETRGPAEAVRPGRGRARGAEEHAVPRGRGTGRAAARSRSASAAPRRPSTADRTDPTDARTPPPPPPPPRSRRSPTPRGARRRRRRRRRRRGCRGTSPGGSSDPRRDRRSTNATSARDAPTPCEDSGSRTSSSAASREGTPPSTRPPRPSTRPPRPSPRPARSHAGAYGRRRGDDFSDAPGDGDGDASAFPRGRRSSAAFGMSSSVDRFGERRVDSVRGRPGGGSRSRSRSPRGGGSPSSFGTGGVVVPGFKLGTRRCSECGLSGKSNRFADEEWDAPRETRVCLSCAEGGGGGAGGGAGGSRVSPLGGRTGASARSARALGYASGASGPPLAGPARGLARTLLPGVLPPRAVRRVQHLEPRRRRVVGSRRRRRLWRGGVSLFVVGGVLRLGRFGLGRRRRSGSARRAPVPPPLPAGRGARRFPCWTRTGRRLQRSPPSPGAGLWFGATARAPDRAYRALADACLLSEEDAFLYRSVSVGRYSEATGGRSKRGEAASYLRRFVSRVAELGMAPEWWTEAHLEELCARAADPSSGLYLRPVDGGVRARARAGGCARRRRRRRRSSSGGASPGRRRSGTCTSRRCRSRGRTGGGGGSPASASTPISAAPARASPRTTGATPGTTSGTGTTTASASGRRNLMEEPDGGTRGGDGAYARGYGDLLAGAGDLEPDRRGGSRSEDASRDERDGFPRGRRSSPSSSLSPGPGRRLGGPPSTLRPLARSRGGAGSMPVRGDTERADAARGGGRGESLDAAAAAAAAAAGGRRDPRAPRRRSSSPAVERRRRRRPPPPPPPPRISRLASSPRFAAAACPAPVRRRPPPPRASSRPARIRR